MPHRTFRDEKGETWDVWDVVPTTVERRMVDSGPHPAVGKQRRQSGESRVIVPADLERGWLAFQCGKDRRRLAPIPNSWADTTADELVELWRRAIPRNRLRQPRD